MEALDEQLSTSSASYKIRVATPTDLPSVLKLFRENFHFEETIFNALCSTAKISQDERRQIETILDNTVKDAFNGSPCLVAVHNESNEVIGLNLTTVTRNEKCDDTSNGDLNFSAYHNTKSALVNQYFEYLSEFNEKAQSYFGYPHKTSRLEFYAIAVAKNHRRVGISGDLIRAGITLAQYLRDIPLVFGVFTSYYSMRSAEKVGMHSVLEIDLLNYKSVSGELIFIDTKPHNIVYIMVLHVPNNNTTDNSMEKETLKNSAVI